MTEIEEGVTLAEFRNPWDTTATLQRIVMVDRDRDLPENLPEGVLVRTPLKRSVVYTTVHNSLIEELGALDAVAGVCDVQYLKDGALKHRIDNMTVADCGSSMAPNVEMMLKLRPDAIMLSAYENSNDHNKVGQLGIPVIDCPDYMETSPLGRAEWMRFFGRLYGKGAEADSIFRKTVESYLAIKEQAANYKEKPRVLTELIYGGSWSVPGAYSTAGVMIEDAAGVNPFAEYKRSGSVQLAPEEVLYKAGNADIWLIKYAQDRPMTLSQLGTDNPLYRKFKAFGSGNVYGLDTNRSRYFEEAAFHPDRVLAEYVELFHPEARDVAGNHHYYHKLDR